MCLRPQQLYIVLKKLKKICVHVVTKVLLRYTRRKICQGIVNFLQLGLCYVVSGGKAIMGVQHL